MTILRYIRHKSYHPMDLDGICHCKCFFCWDISWQCCICKRCSGIGHIDCRNAKRNARNYRKLRKHHRNKMKFGSPGYRRW